MKFPFTIKKEQRQGLVGKAGLRSAQKTVIDVPSIPTHSSKTAEARKKIQLGAQANAMKVFRKMKNQFADHNKLYRELVQNSVDAGPDRIYFTFTAQHILREDTKQSYLEFITSLLEKKQEEMIKTVYRSKDEVVLESDGLPQIVSHHPGIEILAERQYIFPSYLLYDKQSYLSLLKTKYNLEFPDKALQEGLIVDRFALSLALLQSLPIDKKAAYLDAIVQWNAKVKLGLAEDGLNRISSDGLMPLIERRYTLLRAMDKEGINPQLQEILQESPAAYEERMINAQKDKENVQGTYDHAERTMFRVIKKIDPQASLLETFLSKVPKRLTITQEDFGRGMNHEDRENLLKKIFATSKENDLDQIGRFGVGVISIWALEPSKVIYESVRDNQPWEYHFLKETEHGLPGELYEPEHPREKGTKVTIIVDNLSQEKAQTIIKEASRAIKDDCKHVEKPIYISYDHKKNDSRENNSRESRENDGKNNDKNNVDEKDKINEPFDIPESIKVRFGKKGVEGYIGLTVKARARYRLENNRIRLEEKEGALVDMHKDMRENTFGYNVLISSRYINYDIARENVERDANFQHLTNVVRSQEESIAKAVFARLEEKLQGDARDDTQDLEMWDFAKYYLTHKWELANKTRKKEQHQRMCSLLPADISASTIAFNLDNQPYSIEKILQYLAAQKEKILYFSPRKSEVANLLLSQGKEVFLDYASLPQLATREGDPLSGFSSRPLSLGNRINDLLRIFSARKDADYMYSSVDIPPTLTPQEQHFLDSFAQLVSTSSLRRNIGKVVGSYVGLPKQKKPDSNGSSSTPESSLTQAPPFVKVYGGTSSSSFYFEVGNTAPAQQRHGFKSWLSRTKASLRWGSAYASLDILALNLNHSYIRRLINHETMAKDGFSQNLLLQSVAQMYHANATEIVNQLLHQEASRRGYR